MKARQRGAIEHPTRFDDLAKPPHKNRCDRIRNRLSMLTVSEVFRGTWIWHASMSYQSPELGRVLYLGEWTASMTRRGDKELRRLVDGVGDQVVFSIRPHSADPPSEWEGLVDLEQADVINDPDASAIISKVLGYNLPCPPAKFAAMHLWKTLTTDELKLVLN